MHERILDYYGNEIICDACKTEITKAKDIAGWDGPRSKKFYCSKCAYKK